MGYESSTVYTFEAGDVTWATITVASDKVMFEETEKNGQEDCHVYGTVELGADGQWQLTEGEEGMRMYCYATTAERVVAFFNEHGSPVGSGDEALAGQPCDISDATADWVSCDGQAVTAMPCDGAITIGIGKHASANLSIEQARQIGAIVDMVTK